MQIKMQKYKINGANSGGYPIGTICYEFNRYDYGLASDDTRATGKPHVSVTLNSDGDYPSFTIREDFLEKVD